MFKKTNNLFSAQSRQKPGELVEGAVLEKKNRCLFVDLGILGTGIVRGEEYFKAKDTIKDLKPGDLVSARVNEDENDDGFVELSLKDISKEKNWQILKEMAKNNEITSVKIVDSNSGGLMAEVLGLKGFLPASQLTSNHYPKVEGGEKERVAEELKKLIGQEFKVKILDVEPNSQKLILSEKAAEYGDIKDLIAQYKINDIVDCVVSKITDFGAFVKFGDPSIDGLVHISEFDYKLVANPSEFIKEGESIKAQIISMDNNRVSLSLKTLKLDPWEEIEKKYQVGEAYPGKVAHQGNFGYLVELEPDIIGIYKHPHSVEKTDELVIDQTYPFTIISLDRKSRHIILSLAEKQKDDTKTE